MTHEPFQLQQTVYIEDTDCYGVVYYANYLKFFERARSEWLIQHQLTLTECLDNDVMFVVREANLTYHYPLYLHDRFIITALPRIRSRSSVVFEQSIRLINRPEVLLTEGQVTLVTVNAKRKVVRVPPQITRLISHDERQSGL